MQEQQRPNRMLIWGCAAVTTLVVFTCCLIPIAVLAGGAILAGISESNEVTDQNTEVLAVSETPVNLKVVNEVGTVSIRGDKDAEEIEVEIIRRATGLSEQRARDLLSQITVDVRNDGNQYLVEVNDVNDDFAFFEHHSVELRITVPEALNVDVTSDVGSISVRNVNIVNALNLVSEVGAIEFEGRIGPEGKHNITSNVGAIEIEVTEGSRFKLDARADVGGIDNNLDLDTASPQQESTGETLTGQYGEGGDELATLTITTHVGGITLKD